MTGVKTFDQYFEEYDQWFDQNEAIYRAEIAALERFVPSAGRGLEIGVGTGRFAVPLTIQFGVDPAMGMVRRAVSRGVQVCLAYGEQLPFAYSSFDYVLLVTVDCFVEDLRTLFQAIGQVLRPHGRIIIGHIDKNSPLGQVYEARKNTDKFYREAHFRSVDEITGVLAQVGFDKMQFCQTVFGIPGKTSNTTQVLDGYGEGAFAVISAEKM
jgi:SAM-dependent methyltransferase